VDLFPAWSAVYAHHAALPMRLAVYFLCQAIGGLFDIALAPSWHVASGV
jgi:hypothetical protein